MILFDGLLRYMGNTSGKSGCNGRPFLAVEGFYRNDDVRIFVISGIVIFCMHGVVSYNIVSQCILLLNTVLHDITWYPWYCKLATTYIMYFSVCQALGASSHIYCI